jgi:elongation factor Ts
MAEITATLVNELRKVTGLGLMECKKLLQEAEGVLEKAVTLAKERGLKAAEKRAGRAGKAGRIETAIAADGKSGSMIEICCETDFVARNDDFRQMAKELAQQALDQKLTTAEALLASTLKSAGKPVKDALLELSARTGENVSLTRAATFTGAGQVDAYIHHDNTKGALIAVSQPTGAGLVRDLAMQAVAARPVAIQREDVPEAVVAEQKRIFLVQMANDPAMAQKPEQVREKIATGKLDAWFKESTLLEQEFVKDPTKKVREVVAAAGKDLKVLQMACFIVGEEPSAAAEA